jgi:hypothetical protein
VSAVVEASVVMPGGPEQTWEFLFGDELRRVVELSRMVVAVQHYRMRSDGTPHYTMVMRVGPFSIRGISDYVVYDRPRRTVNRVLDSPFGGAFHMDFEAVPGGTRVTERWEVEPRNRLAALVLPAVRPLLARLLQRDLDAWAGGARRRSGSLGPSGRPPGD